MKTFQRAESGKSTKIRKDSGRSVVVQTSETCLGSSGKKTYSLKRLERRLITKRKTIGVQVGLSDSQTQRLDTGEEPNVEKHQQCKSRIPTLVQKCFQKADDEENLKKDKGLISDEKDPSEYQEHQHPRADKPLQNKSRPPTLVQRCFQKPDDEQHLKKGTAHPINKKKPPADWQKGEIAIGDRRTSFLKLRTRGDIESDEESGSDLEMIGRNYLHVSNQKNRTQRVSRPRKLDGKTLSGILNTVVNNVASDAMTKENGYYRFDDPTTFQTFSDTSPDSHFKAEDLDKTTSPALAHSLQGKQLMGRLNLEAGFTKGHSTNKIIPWRETRVKSDTSLFVDKIARMPWPPKEQASVSLSRRAHKTCNADPIVLTSLVSEHPINERSAPSRGRSPTKRSSVSSGIFDSISAQVHSKRKPTPGRSPPPGCSSSVSKGTKNSRDFRLMSGSRSPSPRKSVFTANHSSLSRNQPNVWRPTSSFDTTKSDFNQPVPINKEAEESGNFLRSTGILRNTSPSIKQSINERLNRTRSLVSPSKSVKILDAPLKSSLKSTEKLIQAQNQSKTVVAKEYGTPRHYDRSGSPLNKRRRPSSKEMRSRSAQTYLQDKYVSPSPSLWTEKRNTLKKDASTSCRSFGVQTSSRPSVKFQIPDNSDRHSHKEDIGHSIPNMLSEENVCQKYNKNQEDKSQENHQSPSKEHSHFRQITPVEITKKEMKILHRRSAEQSSFPEQDFSSGRNSRKVRETSSGSRTPKLTEPYQYSAPKLDVSDGNEDRDSKSMFSSPHLKCPRESSVWTQEKWAQNVEEVKRLLAETERPISCCKYSGCPKTDRCCRYKRESRDEEYHQKAVHRKKSESTRVGSRKETSRPGSRERSFNDEKGKSHDENRSRLESPDTAPVSSKREYFGNWKIGEEKSKIEVLKKSYCTPCSPRKESPTRRKKSFFSDSGPEKEVIEKLFGMDLRISAQVEPSTTQDKLINKGTKKLPMSVDQLLRIGAIPVPKVHIQPKLFEQQQDENIRKTPLFGKPHDIKSCSEGRQLHAIFKQTNEQTDPKVKQLSFEEALLQAKVKRREKIRSLAARKRTTKVPGLEQMRPLNWGVSQERKQRKTSVEDKEPNVLVSEVLPMKMERLSAKSNNFVLKLKKRDRHRNINVTSI